MKRILEGARGSEHDAATKIYELCLDDLVPRRTWRLFRRDGCRSARAEAVFSDNTIFPHRHFRPSRWTILASILSISPQHIDGRDQIRDRSAILAHSRSACRHVGTDGVTVTFSPNPQALKLVLRGYEAPVTFTNVTNGQGTARRTAKLTIKRSTATAASGARAALALICKRPSRRSFRSTEANAPLPRFCSEGWSCAV
jgi:hypothetical protein